MALDPEFAAAHAALGRAHVAAADYYVREPRAALEAGRLAAARALEIDPSDSDAHLTLAEVRKTVDWDWDGAEAAYRSALAFNPSNEAVHRLYGMFLAARGRTAGGGARGRSRVRSGSALPRGQHERGVGAVSGAGIR